MAKEEFDLDDFLDRHESGSEEEPEGDESESEEGDQEEAAGEPEPEEPAAAAKKPEKIEIVVEDDPKYKTRWRKDPKDLLKEDEGDKDYSRKVQRRFGQMRAAATEVERQKSVAEAEKAEAIRIALAYKARIEELEAQHAAGQVSALESAKTAQDKSIEAAEGDLRAAFSAGDMEKVIAAQKKLGEAQANRVRVSERLEDTKRTVEAQKAAPQQQSQPQPQAQAPPALPANRAAWFSANPWFRLNPSSDDKLSNFAIDTHKRLIERGYKGDSPEYFSAIDSAMRARFPEEFGIRRSRPVTPPANRVSSSSSNRPNPITGNKVTLTKSQLATARSIGIDTDEGLREYALQIASLGD